MKELTRKAPAGSRPEKEYRPAPAPATSPAADEPCAAVTGP